ncbi:MAG: hypothetical protein WC624_07060 [Candidatus Margulisiibacteriota bacterium]
MGTIQRTDITKHIQTIKQFAGPSVETPAIPPDALRGMLAAICASPAGLSGLTWTIDKASPTQTQKPAIQSPEGRYA